MTRQREEELRIGFFRKHRSNPGFSSVCVQEEPDGAAYLDVEVTSDVIEIDQHFEGVPVRVAVTPPFVNAVLPVSERP
jgi:hypothetical protein